MLAADIENAAGFSIRRWRREGVDMTDKGLLLEGVTLIDGLGGPPTASASVAIEDGRIRAVGPRESLRDWRGRCEVRDVAGLTLMPGLIDCHVHITMDGAASGQIDPNESDALAVLRAAKFAEETLAAGVTTVRDVGGKNYIEFALRAAIEEGLYKGPRLVLSGKSLSITARGMEFFPGMYREANGPDDVKKGAREQLKVGADFLKVYATGAVMTPGEQPGAPQYDVEEMQAAVEEARKQGKKVAAHAHGAQGIRNALLAGVSTIEHGTYLHTSEDLLSLMAERGAFLVPTLKATYLIGHMGTEAGIPAFMVEKAKVVFEHQLESVRQARESGIPIAMGTDVATPYNLHGENAGELGMMVQAGMSPMESIVASTKVAAAACGLGEETGTIEPGKWADLLLVDGDPSQDISILEDRSRIKLVIKQGQIQFER